ncbi:MAG: fasciclin domain-containing protein [Thermoleophilia bacterium]|jgi:uncharacterized surface protein with fasciclin (FAS1) repeats|nr:fasciclin domain-containing protein [Thermoleophilia bacterium]
MKRTALSLAVIAGVAVPSALVAGSATGSSHSPGTIPQVASAAGFSTLVTLVQDAGLAGALSAPKPKLTVFAPTNAAFNRVPRSTLNQLAGNEALLQSVLKYHVVRGAVPASKVVTLNGKSVRTLNGKSIRITVRGGNVFLNGNTRVTKTDVKASNGVIHVINRVLLPPS